MFKAWEFFLQLLTVTKNQIKNSFQSIARSLIGPIGPPVVSRAVQEQKTANEHPLTRPLLMVVKIVPVMLCKRYLVNYRCAQVICC